MTYMTLPTERLSLSRLLRAAARDRAVFLTVGDHVRFVLLPADDGDQEVCALQNNAEFMAYLQDSIERSKAGKRYSLAEIKAKYGLIKKTRRTPNTVRAGARGTTRKTA